MLLASSIHDMKNSLSMLLHSLDVMFQRASEEQNGDTEELAVLQYEATRVNSDLIQLLGLYRLQEKQLPMNIDEHSVFDMIEEQMIINERLFTTQDINVTISCDGALIWYLDPVLIGGVINNVLINSVRYTESKIDINASIEDDYLKIVVSDNGPGYPSAMCE